MSRSVSVEAVGPQALVVDRGRAGWAHIGVPGAGALDGPAHALAQRLVGNDPSDAGLEVLLGGLALRVAQPTTVALTGPPGALTVRRGGVDRPAASHQPVHLAADDVVVVPSPGSGLRSYLALGGGIAVDPVLGSRSADTLSGLGPPPLESGQTLPLGPAPARVASIGTGAVGVSIAPDAIEVAVHLGPRDDWIADARGRLRDTVWTVGPSSDRVGVRLDGEPLERAADHRGEELPSEGLVTGAVQVPPDGLPVVFLADHPTTGGYPVVGVVASGELAAFAQLRPGSSVRLRPATP